MEHGGGYPQKSFTNVDSAISERSTDSAKSEDRFEGWAFPEIEEGKPTKYNWVVQNKNGLQLGYKTDIGAFTYINAKYVVAIEDFV